MLLPNPLNLVFCPELSIRVLACGFPNIRCDAFAFWMRMGRTKAHISLWLAYSLPESRIYGSLTAIVHSTRMTATANGRFVSGIGTKSRTTQTHTAFNVNKQKITSHTRKSFAVCGKYTFLVGAYKHFNLTRHASRKSLHDSKSSDELHQQSGVRVGDTESLSCRRNRVKPLSKVITLNYGTYVPNILTGATATVSEKKVENKSPPKARR